MFYPFGLGDIEIGQIDDGSSSAITLQQAFKYFGITYDQIFVSKTFFIFNIYTNKTRVSNIQPMCRNQSNKGYNQGSEIK